MKTYMLDVGRNMSKDEIQPTEDLVTPERLAKGDLMVVTNLRGKISRAIPAELSIIKELIRRDIFPHYFEVYGLGFLELKHAFLSPMTARSSAVLLEQWGQGVSYGQSMDIFQTVNRRVGKKRVFVIEHTIYEKSNQERVELHDIYREAYEKLVAVMDEEREKFRANLKK